MRRVITHAKERGEGSWKAGLGMGKDAGEGNVVFRLAPANHIGKSYKAQVSGHHIARECICACVAI